MFSFFSELRKLSDDIFSLVHTPSKIKTLFHVSLYSNALYMMLANITSAIFGFVFWIIAAHLYSAELVGTGSAILSAASLLEMLSAIGLGYGLIRFLKSTNNPNKLINSSFTLMGISSLVAAGIFIIGLGFWSPRLNIIRENPFYLVVFLLFVPIMLLDDSTDMVLMAGRQGKFFFIHSLIFNILRILLLVLLAFFSQSFGIFGSLGASFFIALMVAIFLLLPRAQNGYHLFLALDRKIVAEIVHFSFLNYLGDLFWTLPGLILPIIVINLLNAKSNAYFYAAWMISTILTIIPTAVATSLLVEGTYDESNLKNHVARSLKMIAALLIPAIGLIWFLANKILLFYGSVYAENATTLLRWLTIASFPLAINIVYFGIKRVQKKMKPVILLAALMAIITILVAYLILPSMGINGVGIVWLVAQSITALIAITWDIRRWVSK